MRRSLPLLALVALLAGPAAADLAYVTNQNSSDLSVIDLDLMSEVARLDVPGKPAGVSVADGAVYTVSTESRILRRHALNGGATAELALDGGPIGVAVDAPRGRVFVSDWYNARVWVIGARDLKVQRELVTGSAPAGLAVSPDGRWLVTADRDADQISVFDAETLAPRHRVGVGQRPFGVAFAPDGRVFTADVGSNSVTVVNPETGQVLGRVATGARPYAVAFAAGRGFVTNQYADSVTVFDLATLAVQAEIAVGEYPEGIDATEDGTRIVVANWFSNSLTVIDAASLAVIGEIETGDGPRAFGRFVATDEGDG
ncbi:beta-propeller fold lactonase family protein [Paracoccaceae bacterium Fryx2]|nr:beta-propeller fold lactonase family protein [Paracoccaceae bacterium Fryx2]